MNTTKNNNKKQQQKTTLNHPEDHIYSRLLCLETKK